MGNMDKEQRLSHMYNVELRPMDSLGLDNIQPQLNIGIKKGWSQPPPEKYLESQMEYDRAYWVFLGMAIDKSKADFLDRDSPDNDNLHNWSTNER